MHSVICEAEGLCTLVVIGVCLDGTKEVLALEDGYRESSESWSRLLRDLKWRGLRAPVLAIGDEALGIWAALREVWPETAEQRCWAHRIANVLAKVPKRLQSRVMRALYKIMCAESRATAARDIALFAEEYRAKYPRAVVSLTVDQDRLLAYFEYPAEHWKDLRTSHPRELTLATGRLREGATNGAGSKTTRLVVAFKLLRVAEGHWSRLDATGLLSLVRTRASFEDGRPVESRKKWRKAVG